MRLAPVAVLALVSLSFASMAIRLSIENLPNPSHPARRGNRLYPILNLISEVDASC